MALSTVALAGALDYKPSELNAGPGSEGTSDKPLNPNATWLREAKWGVFTHYLAHTASTQVSEEMTGDIWNKRVDSFEVEQLGGQLSSLEVPYFFITIGQGGIFLRSKRNL